MVNARKAFYDPLKDFMTLNRVMRREVLVGGQMVYMRFMPIETIERLKFWLFISKPLSKEK